METGNDILAVAIEDKKKEIRESIPNVVPMLEEYRITRLSWLTQLKKGDVVCRMLGGKFPSLEVIKVIAGGYIFTQEEHIYEDTTGIEFSALMEWSSKDYSPSYIQHYTAALKGKSEQERNVQYVLVSDKHEGRIIKPE